MVPFMFHYDCQNQETTYPVTAASTTDDWSKSLTQTESVRGLCQLIWNCERDNMERGENKDKSNLCDTACSGMYHL